MPKNAVVITQSSRDLTEEELAAMEESYRTFKDAENRVIRNELLSNSDWTQLPDSPLSDENKALWVTYRTSLRNLPDHESWPLLSDEEWPIKPS